MTNMVAILAGIITSLSTNTATTSNATGKTEVVIVTETKSVSFKIEGFPTIKHVLDVKEVSRAWTNFPVLRRCTNALPLTNGDVVAITNSLFLTR